MAGTFNCPNCHGEFQGKGYGGYCSGKCAEAASRVKYFATKFFNKEGYPNGLNSKGM